MKYKFPYQENNGIFRYLYRLDNEYYLKYLNNIKSSPLYMGSQSWSPYNALVFDDNGASWLSNGDLEENYFSFCFTKGLFKATGYELTASGGTSLPYKWSFAGSISNENWENKETKTYSIPKSTSQYFSWSKGPFKCFRIDTLLRQSGDYPSFDVAYLELFGTYYVLDMTCLCKQFSVKCLVLVLVILI